MHDAGRGESPPIEQSKATWRRRRFDMARSEEIQRNKTSSTTAEGERTGERRKKCLVAGTN